MKKAYDIIIHIMNRREKQGGGSLGSERGKCWSQQNMTRDFFFRHRKCLKVRMVCLIANGEPYRCTRNTN